MPQRLTFSGWVTEAVLLVAPALAAIAVFDELALHNLSIAWVGFGAAATFMGAWVLVDYVDLMWRRARAQHRGRP